MAFEQSLPQKCGFEFKDFEAGEVGIFLVKRHEDTSRCSAYQLFDVGRCIEEFHWGVGYTEEFFEISPEELSEYAQEMAAQGTPLADFWNPNNWDIYITSGDCIGYKFRSKDRLTQITEPHLREPELFLDFLFCRQDAWLPDYEYLPWGGISKPEGGKTTDFVRIDGIRSSL